MKAKSVARGRDHQRSPAYSTVACFFCEALRSTGSRYRALPFPLTQDPQNALQIAAALRY